MNEGILRGVDCFRGNQAVSSVKISDIAPGVNIDGPLTLELASVTDIDMNFNCWPAEPHHPKHATPEALRTIRK